MPAIRDKLETCLARAADPAGEGKRAFLAILEGPARDAADAADARSRNGISLGPLDGVIVSVKDLFDMAGQRTLAGSKLRAEAPLALKDSAAVSRLRAAGAVLIGRTNLSEFAFHGIGTNPHYGTPGNPADRSRVPGGSSSGAAVSVADGMAEMGLGTDTGGSVRLPAAFCGIAGFKPSAPRISKQGCFPLSGTLDSIGPLARTIELCHASDCVLSGDEFAPLEAVDIRGIRLGMPAGGYALDDLDATVAAAFDGASRALSKAGARIVDIDFKILSELTAVNALGGIAAVEALQVHRADLDTERALLFDPYVRQRIDGGRRVSGADYVEMLLRRASAIRQMDTLLAGVDAVIMPTAPVVPPRLSEVAAIEVFGPVNLRCLRNTMIGNFFDLCGASVPLKSAALPVGLMILGRHGHDRRCLAVAKALEAVVSR